MAYFTVLEGPMTVADSWRREAVRAERRKVADHNLSIIEPLVPLMTPTQARTAYASARNWDYWAEEASPGWNLERLEEVTVEILTLCIPEIGTETELWEFDR